MKETNNNLPENPFRGGVRNTSIDVLKGICIILVVVGHLYENGEALRHSALYSIIYTFHMPFFMVLSGYVTHYSLKTPVAFTNIHHYVLKKLRSLLLPCVMWTLAFKYFFTNTPDILDIHTLWNLVSRGYWYMPCLFLLYVYLYVALLFLQKVKRYKEWFVTALIVALSVIAGLLIKDEMFRTAMSYSLFFVIGYMLGCKRRLYAYAKSPRLVGVALLAFCLIAGYYSKVVPDSLFNKVVRLVAGLAAIPILFNIGELITEKRSVAFLSYIGRHTLAIYMLHYAFRRSTSLSFLSECNVLIQFAAFSLYALLICFVCILIEKIFETSPITSFLFFGKLKHR